MAESRIVNEARIKNPLVKAVRELLEHRALWLYLLTDEAAKAGADPATFAPAAVRRCGLFQGAGLVAKGGRSFISWHGRGLKLNGKHGALLLML